MKTSTITAYGYTYQATVAKGEKTWNLTGTVFIGKTKSWDKRDLYTDAYATGPKKWYWNLISEDELR